VVNKTAPTQIAEVTAGNGYLSQTTSALHFTADPNSSIKVRWPDGTTTTHNSTPGTNKIAYKK
jgi:hypothetical protein